MPTATMINLIDRDRKKRRLEVRECWIARVSRWKFVSLTHKDFYNSQMIDFSRALENSPYSQAYAMDVYKTYVAYGNELFTNRKKTLFNIGIFNFHLKCQGVLLPWHVKGKFDCTSIRAWLTSLLKIFKNLILDRADCIVQMILC